MKWSTKSRWPWLTMEKSLGHLLPSVPSVLVWVWTDKGRMAFWRMIPPRGLWQHGAGSGWDLLCESPLELSLREQEKVVMLFRMIFWTSAVKEGYKICKEKSFYFFNAWGCLNHSNSGLFCLIGFSCNNDSEIRCIGASDVPDIFSAFLKTW